MTTAPCDSTTVPALAVRAVPQTTRLDASLRTARMRRSSSTVGHDIVPSAGAVRSSSNPCSGPAAAPSPQRDAKWIREASTMMSSDPVAQIDAPVSGRRRGLDAAPESRLAAGTCEGSARTLGPPALSDVATVGACVVGDSTSAPEPRCDAAGTREGSARTLAAGADPGLPPSDLRHRRLRRRPSHDATIADPVTQAKGLTCRRAAGGGAAFTSPRSWIIVSSCSQRGAHP